MKAIDISQSIAEFDHVLSPVKQATTPGTLLAVLLSILENAC